MSRVVQARTEREGVRLLPTMNAVPGIGAEVVLTVNGELRKTRVFRSHEHPGTPGSDLRPL